MKKNSKNTKKVMAIVITTVAAIGILIGSMFGLQNYATDKYWSTPVASDISDVYQLDSKTIALMKETYDEEEQELSHAVTDNGKTLSAELQDVVNKTNEKIIDYFQKKASINVSEKMSKLKVKSFDFDGKGFGGIDGYFDNYNWGDTVYINSTLTQGDSNDTFAQTYIHEAIHYIGFSCRGSWELAYLYEGMTEHLTENLCHAENIPYYPYSSYGMLIESAKEILKVSPELVHEIAEGNGMFNLKEKLNKTFGNQEFANQLENAMNDAMAGSEDAKYALQYLTCEYIKSQGGNEAEINIVKSFGLKWML